MAVPSHHEVTLQGDANSLSTLHMVYGVLHLFAALGGLLFVLMGFAIALRGAGRVLAVTAIVAFVGGLGTWLVAPAHTLHIGASGVVFGYATYLLSRGIFDRDVPELAIGVLVGAIWGTALLSGLLPREGISWQGHLFGAIGGVVAARMLAPERHPAQSTRRLEPKR